MANQPSKLSLQMAATMRRALEAHRAQLETFRKAEGVSKNMGEGYGAATGTPGAMSIDKADAACYNGVMKKANRTQGAVVALRQRAAQRAIDNSSGRGFTGMVGSKGDLWSDPHVAHAVGRYEAAVGVPKNSRMSQPPMEKGLGSAVKHGLMAATVAAGMSGSAAAAPAKSAGKPAASKKAPQKAPAEEKPTYLDMSGPDEKESPFPTVTPKGSLGKADGTRGVKALRQRAAQRPHMVLHAAYEGTPGVRTQHPDRASAFAHGSALDKQPGHQTVAFRVGDTSPGDLTPVKVWMHGRTAPSSPGGQGPGAKKAEMAKAKAPQVPAIPGIKPLPEKGVAGIRKRAVQRQTVAGGTPMEREQQLKDPGVPGMMSKTGDSQAVCPKCKQKANTYGMSSPSASGGRRVMAPHVATEGGKAVRCSGEGLPSDFKDPKDMSKAGTEPKASTAGFKAPAAPQAPKPPKTGAAGMKKADGKPFCSMCNSRSVSGDKCSECGSKDLSRYDESDTLVPAGNRAPKSDKPKGDKKFDCGKEGCKLDFPHKRHKGD